ncbi:MAG: MAPEG family protein [Cyanobacteria bacterium P01_F01_bin.150]
MSVLNTISIPALLLTSIVLASALVYLPFLVVAYARLQAPDGYDQSAPRAMELPAYAKRANWAHQNAFESFIIFAVAALMAYVTGENSGQESITVVYGAIAYLIARLLYPVAYILDIPVMRSLMFGVGNIGIIILFTFSIRSVL